MNTTLFQDSISEVVCRGPLAADGCLVAANTKCINSKWDTNLLTKETRRGRAEIRDPWFLLTLTEDVMKKVFISFLGIEALVINYTFLHLCLFISSSVSSSPFQVSWCSLLSSSSKVLISLPACLITKPRVYITSHSFA